MQAWLCFLIRREDSVDCLMWGGLVAFRAALGWGTECCVASVRLVVLVAGWRWLSLHWLAPTV